MTEPSPDGPSAEALAEALNVFPAHCEGEFWDQARHRVALALTRFAEEARREGAEGERIGIAREIDKVFRARAPAGDATAKEGE